MSNIFVDPVNNTAYGAYQFTTTDSANTQVEEAFVLPKSEDLINEVIDELRDMLMEKNRKYGDSALNPTRIFSKSDSIEQIRVRIDDKLTRLRNMQDDEDEDIILDLMGYLILLRVATLKEKDNELDLEAAKEDTFDWVEWYKLQEKISNPIIPYVPWNPPYISQPYVQPWTYPYPNGNPTYPTWNPFFTCNEILCDDGHVTDCGY